MGLEDKTPGSRRTAGAKGNRPTVEQPVEDTRYPDIPAQVGPVRFGRFCGWVTVRCPYEYSQLVQNAGGMWDPAARRWCVHPRRMDQVLRELLRLSHP